MRVWPVAMALSLVSQAVCSQPSGDPILRLKSCFQLERVPQTECLEQLSRELADTQHKNSTELATRAWIVSETISPVDYSPLIMATISSQPTAKDAPATFIIGCRGQRTHLLVSTEGWWRPSRANELQVDFKVNDRPSVRMQWIASSDGRTATFKGDAIQLLRSLPDGGRIIVSVSDWQGAPREASFQLAGLDPIRQKIAAACKWTQAEGRMAPVGP
jgi:type VI secretion system (T6SS) VasI/EvfG family protein